MITQGTWRKCGLNVSVHPECYYLLKNSAKIPMGELESNARLIAAAPELLNACKLAKTLLLDLEQAGTIDNPEEFHVLRQAIAKAESN
jgi:hypothetical protein